MDAMTFRCPGCGGTVDIDLKTRKGVCGWCGNSITIPRKQINGLDDVQSELTVCVRSFLEKRFGAAKDHAERVLAIAIDNAPALYARTYYEAYAADIRNTARMTGFFEQLQEIEPDGEEAENLKEMFLSTVFKLDAYEENVLRWASTAFSGQELCAFVDAFSVQLIPRRTTIDFLTPGLVEAYKNVAAACTAPKTCYALLQAILNNPDSPFRTGCFYLKTKTQRFYRDFLLPVGEILNSMASPELKNKFCHVYQSKKEEFEKKMEGGNNNA